MSVKWTVNEVIAGKTFKSDVLFIYHCVICFADNFQTRLVHGMLFMPLLREWKWVQDTSINYALHAVKD